MISVSHLVKRYGAHLAVDDVSFEVKKNEIVGFLGPNGAGKSTTLRILAGFLGMTSGKVTIGGHDVVDDVYRAREQIGYMPEAVPLYPEMRVVEYLTFRAELKGVPRAKRRAWIDEAMTKASVMDVATQTIGSLSKGYRQRVGLADAIVAKPPLLVLDEPTAGLDPNQIREVRALLRALKSDHTVLLSTHILSEVEAVCDEIVVIAKGKLVAQGTKDEIRKRRKSPGVELLVRGDGEKARALLAACEGVAKTKITGDDPHTRVRCTWKKDLTEDGIANATERLITVLVGASFGVREVVSVGSSLEDVFAELTRGADHDEREREKREQGDPRETRAEDAR